MKRLFFLFFLLVSLTGCAQAKVAKHTVTKGETVTQIAQRYSVTPADIYRLNPDAQSGLKEGAVLLIPSATKAVEKPKTETAKGDFHIVAAGETLYGLARKYDVSVSEIEKRNPSLMNGLKVGDTIFLPSKGKKAEEKPKNDDKKPTAKEPIFHTVAAGETKYGIARQYGISVEELEAANPEIKNGLQIGYRLKIQGNRMPQPVEETPRSIVKKEEPKAPEFQEYAVKPKETLYGLSKRFGISQEQLVQLNPELAGGVREGMLLRIPAGLKVLPADRTPGSLAATLNTTERKKLVMLLPFNISKIQGDTVNSVSARLKNDKFLNMTLDFYSGALMAIDSAKTLGLNVEVRILDSQETKGASGVASLVQTGDLASADAIIGPFYQANAEKTAELLTKANVPVISPLSKDKGKPFANLVQTMTQEEELRDGTYAYMVANGNVVAVVDPKKLSVKKYLAENQKDVRLAPFVNGALSADGLKALLQRDRKNYVVLETESTLMIKSTINALLPLVGEYPIQLAITGPNETLDFEEIQVANLVKLNLLYPSLTHDNESPQASIFSRQYKEKNKIYPNRFATRGFDVTFDTLLRLSQSKSYMETVSDDVTEQVENKFDFAPNGGGGFVNTGFYILYYDTDMSVKIAQ